MRTSEIARAAGVHPNTVRLYEQWGFLQPAPRLRNGYREFSKAHLDQMLLARTALHGTWPGRAIRRSALELVRLGAAGGAAAARRHARRHLELVLAERRQAEEAARVLEQWARASPAGAVTPMNIGKAAALLDLTVDTLRSWERNGLLRPPRTPGNYRLYGAEETARLRVIRLLMRSGYSPMAILRMLTSLERHGPADLRRVLDTPRPDEDVYTAFDRWLSALSEQEERARRMIAILSKRR